MNSQLNFKNKLYVPKLSKIFNSSLYNYYHILTKIEGKYEKQFSCLEKNMR